jgi:hypothetical protein
MSPIDRFPGKSGGRLLEKNGTVATTYPCTKKNYSKYSFLLNLLKGDG